MKAEAAIKLVRECKRHPTTLPAYNDAMVRTVFAEIDMHDAAIEALPPSLGDRRQGAGEEEEHDLARSAKEEAKRRADECAFNVHTLTASYSKRCLLAYHMHRAHLIKQICWDVGMIPADTRRKLSGPEVAFHQQYESLLRGTYRRHFSDLDLFSAPLPPKDLFVEVRVLKDCGEIYTEDGGTIHLAPGAQLLVKRKDVESFITMGYLIHL